MDDKILITKLAKKLNVTTQAMWYMIRRARLAFPKDFKTEKVSDGKAGKKRTYIGKRDAERLEDYHCLRHPKYRAA